MGEDDLSEGEGGGDEAVTNEARDLSESAIEARMNEIGGDYDDGKGPPKSKKDAKVEGDPDDAPAGDVEEKPEAELTDEEKKSWQAKMKGEVATRDAQIKDLAEQNTKWEERENAWQTAANETLMDLRAVASERDHYAALLKKHGIEEDAPSRQLREANAKLARLEGGAGLQKQVAEQRGAQQQLAEAKKVRDQVAVEAKAVMGKYPEMKDPEVAEDILTTWAAAVGSAEARGKKPPTMADFVKRHIAALRLEKANAKQNKIGAGGARQNRRPPQTLRANGSSAQPTKFPATDEGIEAWAKARGYDS